MHMGEGRSIWKAELKGLARALQVGWSSRRWGRLLELVAEPRWSNAEVSRSWMVGKAAAWGRKRQVRIPAENAPNHVLLG
jgi:hypothetical protein